MKANSRRRVLISSVAMLLVAIVALGTSTYAWFSVKKTADADGISINSSKASGLLISEDNASWSSVINYSNVDAAKHRAAVLEPVSSALQTLSAPLFYKGIADDPTSFETTGDFTKADYTNASGLVNVYDLYAKTADGSETELTLNVDGSITDAGEYGRIAVIRYKNDAIEDDADAIKVYYMAAEGAEETAVYPIKEDKTEASAYPITPVNNLSDISLGKISTSTHFKIFVWNEGQDNDCYTLNADKALSFNINLSID